MRAVILVVMFLLAGFTCNLALAETILISREIPVAKGIFIPSTVNNVCSVGTEFADQLSASIGARGYTVQFTNESLRERARIAEAVTMGNARRARVDLKIAAIELKAAELALEEAKTEKERAEARYSVEDARVKRASAELILANDRQSIDRTQVAETGTAEDYKYLFIEIEEIDAESVGAFGASNQVRRKLRINGQYRQGMELIASFVGQRASWNRNLKKGAKAACGVIRYNMKTLARDVGEWLKSPRNDAGLGDLEGCALRVKSQACQPK